MPKLPRLRLKPGLIVGGGAGALEALIQRLQAGTISSRTIEYAWLACGRAHVWTGRLLLFLGRQCGRVLARAAWPFRLSLWAAVLAALTALLYGFGRTRLLDRVLEPTEKQIGLLHQAGMLASFNLLLTVAFLAAVLLTLAVGVAFVRHRLALLYLKASAIVFSVVWLFLLYFIVDVPGFLYVSDGKVFTKFRRNELWVAGFWIWLGLAAVGALYLLCLFMSGVRAWYHRVERAEEQVGDRIAREIVSGGREPVCRTSFYWAAFLHILVLFLIPLIMRGCEPMQDPYGVPLGEGLQVIQVVQIKKPKKQKPKKKYFLNPNSPISFFRPDIDLSDIREEVERDTRDTYVATALTQVKSGLGKGGPGKGGWPHGMANARVRFIRLKYDGGDWDQDMGVGADYNLLVMFKKFTGFKIADNTEAIPVTALRHFPKHRAPPFIFLTGSGSINVSTEEVKTLRWYCLEESGLIFADNGGGNFNSSFRGLMKRCFPELDHVDVANDDIIFQQPFLFPNGAPPLWHHSGHRAVGWKHNERWIVFYHQGDVNDAWKTGHSGATDAQAMQAYKLGVNLMNYAFNQYMAAHFDVR